jgi:hypothetical protein
MKAPKRRSEDANLCHRPNCGGVGPEPVEGHPADHARGPVWRFAFGKWARIVAEDPPLHK